MMNDSRVQSGNHPIHLAPCRFLNAIFHSQGSGLWGEMADDRARAGEV